MVQPSLTFTKTTSAQSKKSQGLVLDALERLQHKSPGRQNSYSDSTDGDEEVEEAFSTSTVEHSRQSWERSVYHTPSGTLGEYDGAGQGDDTIHSAFYSPDLSMTRSDLSKGYVVSVQLIVRMDLTSTELPLILSNLWCFISCPPSPVGTDLESDPTSAPSPDPLPPPLPLPLNLTMSSNGQDTEEFVPVSTEGAVGLKNKRIFQTKSQFCNCR